MSAVECRICPEACDPAFHASSDRIRAWLRERLQLALSQPIPAPTAPKREVVEKRRVNDSAPAPIPARPARPHASSGGRPAVYRGLAIEKIVARQKEGATLMQIAAEQGCSFALIYKLLKRAGRDNEEFRAEQEALHTCPLCGGAKWPSRPKCHACRKLQAAGAAA